MIKRALISVFDKHGVVDFARGLQERGIELLSTGGTARVLVEHGVPVIEVSAYTDFPEIMGGRVKTLHPRIHGGLLARPGLDDAHAEAYGIQPIELLVVNLYPFEQAVSDPACHLMTAIEQIDIGGPAMLRAAAKNFTAVTVVVDRADYGRVLAELQDRDGRVSDGTRRAFAVKAFEHTARYDGAIANYLGSLDDAGERTRFPHILNLQLRKAQELRYGENPHQRAAFYTEQAIDRICVSNATQLQGKALSFNNLADADAALECVKDFAEPACVIVKHANPCGVAMAEDLCSAYDRAYRTDPISAFGGIIAFNHPLDRKTASAIVKRQFVEVIIAPQVEPDALDVLGAKSNIRLLACGEWHAESRHPTLDYKRVTGGLLVQEQDTGTVTEAGLKLVTQRAPTPAELRDLLFSWKVVKYVKSNAIVFGKEAMTIGLGAGQMSRLESVRIAALKAQEAGLVTNGAVMASDAFFPFRDGVVSAAAVGIKAIIQPGGSKRDAEVIEAADEHGMAMVFTGMRHFRH